MDLIEIYIQEVTRRLPEKNREDIALELRSTIEDMLSDDFTEEDVKKVLEKLGNPASLASGYLDRPMHLIGPRYFDLYVSLLKLILPIAGVIAAISMIASHLFSYNGEEAILSIIIKVFSEGIGILIEVGIQVAFWLTFTFAIIERCDKGKDSEPLTMNYTKWTPDDLKNVTYIPKKRLIPKGEVYFSLIWTAIWATVYFNANQLLGIYVNEGNGLEFVTPALNQEVLLSYWPFVVLVIGLEIVLALFKLIKGQWSLNLAIFNTIYEIIATVITIVVIINPNLFQPDFTSYMADLFSITVEQFTNRVISGVILMFVLFGGINAFDGFRKARRR
ncbi:hypothetical protein HHO41_05070 [Bacillus sp. DNRA2]|uniref:HAAS signaling domain-containing protein n=1 Tax=Bacillus sp. DNRA2 TaxID=2723053 RepID=UPI00145F122D|nr:hypothetical protein [Bacillus sp. DNRA2]NMD69650.1 hypothetical protein [Bacillus sp. DNRA2]